jgi:chromosome segregation ATPase
MGVSLLATTNGDTSGFKPQYLHISITNMTQATDTDIRELKTAIDGNTKAVEAIDRRIEALTRTTEANAKAIADLTLEMRMGFSNVETKFTEVKGLISNLDTKLSGQITNLDTKLEGKIDTLTGKFDERTKGLGTRLDGKELAQRNIFTGLTVTIVGGILLTLGRFLFFGISIKP